MQTREIEPNEGEEPELIKPEDFLPRDRFPDDARRMGLDRWSGAELDFVSKLDASNPRHRLFAGVLLALFLTPVLMTVLFLLR